MIKIQNANWVYIGLMNEISFINTISKRNGLTILKLQQLQHCKQNTGMVG